MKNREGRLPSPALLVAVIALVVALSGSAIALPGKNKVGSNDITNNSVKSADLKDGTGVKPIDLHPTARLWAEVSSEGLLVGASQDNVVSARTGDGSYLVDFNRGDIIKCSTLATITAFTPGGGVPSGEITTEPPAVPSDTIRVATSNSDGNAASRAFTVAILC